MNNDNQNKSKITNLNQFNEDSISIIGHEFDNFLNENLHIKSFLEYLSKNNIKFQILEKIQDSFIVLKTLTLEPKYFIIVLKRNDLKNYSIEYNIFNYFQKKFSIDGEKDKLFYILFLDSSINSFQEVLFKSKYSSFRNISLKKEFKRIIDSNVKISIKKELRKGLPLGIYSDKNKLNDLTGQDWIKFTKSWFIHNPPPRNNLEILHPAKFPETLIEDFINFFTKKGQIVLDPFLGTGSTAIAAKNSMRSCIGIEIIKKYADISKERVSQSTLDKWVESDKINLEFNIINADSNDLDVIWKKYNLPLIDFCITSPPYWNQLKRNSMRQEGRKEQGLDTIYSNDPLDIGNTDDYKEFIEAQKKIFYKVYNVLKNNSYLIIITNNVFYNGRLYPLAYDTAISLSDKFVLKDEKIWCQNDKALLPLGINNAWVANRCHQYCLIFRKEESS